MIPQRFKLLGILAQLNKADTATTQILKLDVGPAADTLAEILAKIIEDVRAIVQELLREQG